MPLYAYNRTAAPLALAAGSPSPPTLAAATSAGAYGPAYNVTSELRGLSGANYTALQAQVASSSVYFQWTQVAEYPVGSLQVGFANTQLYLDAALGDDANPGTQAQPFKTLEKAFSAIPASWPGTMQLNIVAGTYAFAAGSARSMVFGSAVGPGAPGSAGTPHILRIQGDTMTVLATYTVTTGSNGDTFADTAQAPTLDQYYGLFVTCTSGLNVGQRRQITAVTAGVGGQVTVNVPFTNVVSVGDVYVIQQPSVIINVTGFLSLTTPNRIFMNQLQWNLTPSGGQSLAFGGTGGGGIFMAPACYFNFAAGGTGYITYGSTLQGRTFPIGSALEDACGYTIRSASPGTVINIGDGQAGPAGTGGNMMYDNFVQIQPVDGGVINATAFFSRLARIAATGSLVQIASRNSNTHAATINGKIQTAAVIASVPGAITGVNAAVVLSGLDMSNNSGAAVALTFGTRGSVGTSTVNVTGTGNATFGIIVNTLSSTFYNATTTVTGTSGDVQLGGMTMTYAQVGTGAQDPEGNRIVDQ